MSKGMNLVEHLEMIGKLKEAAELVGLQVETTDFSYNDEAHDIMRDIEDLISRYSDRVRGHYSDILEVLEG